MSFPVQLCNVVKSRKVEKHFQMLVSVALKTVLWKQIFIKEDENHEIQGRQGPAIDDKMAILILNGRLPYLTQLRVGLSKLNFHKFKHNFRDTINPMCPTSDGIEDTEHFLLLCPSFDLQRRDLLAGIEELLRPFVQIASLSNDALTQLLLYGDQDLSNDLNKNILELTLRFIHKTGRFD